MGTASTPAPRISAAARFLKVFISFSLHPMSAYRCRLRVWLAAMLSTKHAARRGFPDAQRSRRARDDFPNNFVGDLVPTERGWVVVPPTCCPAGHDYGDASGGKESVMEGDQLIEFALPAGPSGSSVGNRKTSVRQGS